MVSHHSKYTKQMQISFISSEDSDYFKDTNAKTHTSHPSRHLLNMPQSQS